MATEHIISFTHNPGQFPVTSSHVPHPPIQLIRALFRCLLYLLIYDLIFHRYQFGREEHKTRRCYPSKYMIHTHEPTYHGQSEHINIYVPYCKTSEDLISIENWVQKGDNPNHTCTYIRFKLYRTLFNSVFVAICLPLFKKGSITRWSQRNGIENCKMHNCLRGPDSELYSLQKSHSKTSTQPPTKSSAQQNQH